jgi:hypothetical protein
MRSIATFMCNVSVAVLQLHHVLRDNGFEVVGPLDGVALAGLRLAEWPMSLTIKARDPKS